MEAVLVRSGGVKSLPEFQRSKEQVVVSDMAYGASRMSPVRAELDGMTAGGFQKTHEKGDTEINKKGEGG